MIDCIKTFFVYLWTMLRLRYYYELGVKGNFMMGLHDMDPLLDLRLLDFHRFKGHKKYEDLVVILRQRAHTQEETRSMGNTGIYALIKKPKEPTRKDKVAALFRAISPKISVYFGFTRLPKSI